MDAREHVVGTGVIVYESHMRAHSTTPPQRRPPTFQLNHCTYIHTHTQRRQLNRKRCGILKQYISNPSVSPEREHTHMPVENVACLNCATHPALGLNLPTYRPEVSRQKKGGLVFRVSLARDRIIDLFTRPYRVSRRHMTASPNSAEPASDC